MPMYHSEEFLPWYEDKGLFKNKYFIVKDYLEFQINTFKINKAKNLMLYSPPRNCKITYNCHIPKEFSFFVTLIKL